MFRTVGWEGLCCVVAILAPVSRLPMAAAAPPVGPGRKIWREIHVLPSLVPQCRQANLFRQIFRSGAGDYIHDFVMDRESDTLYWLAKCINIALRDSGMRGEGQ